RASSANGAISHATSARGRRTYDAGPASACSVVWQGHALPLRSMSHACLNEFVVTHSGCARSFGKARVVCGIGKNPGKRVHLDHVGHACRIESHIDPRPIATAERVVGGEHDS